MSMSILEDQNKFWTRAIINLLILLFFIFFIFAYPYFLKAETNDLGAIQGRITDQSGTPLSNIQVLATEYINNSYQVPFSINYFPYTYPPWTPEEDIQEMIERYYSNPYFFPFSPYPPPYPTTYRTQTQSDGAFLLENLPEKRYILWAYDTDVSGYKPSIYGFNKDMVEDLEFPVYSLYYGGPPPNFIPIRVIPGETAGPINMVMEMGGILSGRITDEEDGSPIEGARISVTLYKENWMGFTPSFNTVSDSNGDFSVAGLAEGKYMVVVSEAEGYIIDLPLSLVEGGSQENLYEVFAGQTTENCNIALKHGGEIWGRVTNKANGEPIADIFISYYETESNAYYYFPISKTNTDGTYHITGLEGDYYVMVYHSDNFQGAYYPNTQDSTNAEKIHVYSGESVGPIDFQLVSYPTEENIRGMVVEEGTNLPLSGMMVTLIKTYPGVSSIQSFPEPVPVMTIDEDQYRDEPSSEPMEPPHPPLDLQIIPVFTGEDGRFAFRVSEKGAYLLEILDPTNTYLRSTYPKEGELDAFFELSEDQTIADIQITLKRGGCLEGQVLDGSDILAGIDVKAIDISKGVPFTGGFYAYATPYGSFPVFSDITDTEGWFHICGLKESEFILLAQDLHDRGYMPSFHEDENVTNIPQSLNVSSGSTIYDAFISMKPGFSLTGRVVDKTGNPLADIKIKAALETFPFQDTIPMLEYRDLVYPSYAWTQEDGTYTLTGLAEGTYTITAMDTDSFYVPNSLLDIPVSSISDGTVSDLILYPGGILSGKITNTTGQPLAGIEVLAIPEYDYPTPYTDYGTYEGSDDDPNDGSLSAFDPNFPSYYVDFYGGDPNDISYNGPYYDSGYYESYSGTGYNPDYSSSYDPNVDTYYSYPSNDPNLVSYDGTGYGTGFVAVFDTYPELAAITKADGSFHIKGVPAGDYLLEAYDPQEEYLEAEYNASTPSGFISVSEGEEIIDLDFTLSRGGTINGSIRDSATGNPLGGFIIRAQSDQEYQTFYSTPSDEQGNYTIRKLPGGSYSLYALQHDDYQPQYYSGATEPEDATLLEITLEEMHQGIDFNLVPGIRLSGTVKDALTGQAISERCSVKISNESASVIRTSYTNSNGEYQFRGLPLETYSVRATYSHAYYPECYRGPEGDSATCTPITPSGPGEVEGIDLFLEPMASISGKVMDESDLQPLSNKWVLAIPSYNYSDSNLPYYGYGYGFYSSESSAVTDPNGRYIIENLPEGDYRILARDPWYVYAAQYYNDIPEDQWDQADIIHLERSESRTGINFELQVGDTYSGDAISSTSGSSYQYYSGYAGFGTTYYGAAGFQPTGVYGLYVSGSAGIGGDSTTPSPSPSPGEPYPKAPVPEIKSKPERQVLAGRSYLYQIQVEDPGEEASFTYSLKENPEGMSIDSQSGLVHWEPSNQNAGKAIVQVAVHNDTGQVALQSFRLEIDPDYSPPEKIQNLKASKGSGKVTLSWNPPEDIDGDLARQILYIEDDKGNKVVVELDKDTSEYTVKDLENDQRYSFTITTRDRLGNESEGVIVNATPITPQTISRDWLIPGFPWSNLTDLLTSTTPLFPINNQVLPFWSSRISRSQPPITVSDFSTPTIDLWNIQLLNPLGSLYSLYPLYPWISPMAGFSTQHQWSQGTWNRIVNLYPDLQQPWLNIMSNNPFLNPYNSYFVNFP